MRIVIIEWVRPDAVAGQDVTVGVLDPANQSGQAEPGVSASAATVGMRRARCLSVAPGKITT
jgi:hypothetical protein